MSTLVDRLFDESSALVSELAAHPIARRFLYDPPAVDRPPSREEVGGYLVNACHYVWWAYSLLDSAGRRAREAGRCPELADLLRVKAREEVGHDGWARQGLVALGYDAELVERVGPSPSVRAYVIYNRYQAEHGVPEAFAGTAFVLEAMSEACAAPAAAIVRACGQGDGSLESFFQGHAEADGAHIAELCARLHDVSHPVVVDAIITSAKMTRALYPGFFTPLG